MKYTQWLEKRDPKLFSLLQEERLQENWMKKMALVAAGAAGAAGIGGWAANQSAKPTAPNTQPTPMTAKAETGGKKIVSGKYNNLDTSIYQIGPNRYQITVLGDKQNKLRQNMGIGGAPKQSEVARQFQNMAGNQIAGKVSHVEFKEKRDGGDVDLYDFYVNLSNQPDTNNGDNAGNSGNQNTNSNKTLKNQSGSFEN